MKTKIKIAYKYYRMIWDNKLMLFIDEFVASFIFHYLRISVIFQNWLAGYIEDYIIERGYSRMSQFDKVFTDEALYNMALTIHTTIGWGWTDVRQHFLDISNNSVYLSKNRCYEILKKARAIYGEDKKGRKGPHKSR